MWLDQEFDASKKYFVKFEKQKTRLQDKYQASTQ